MYNYNLLFQPVPESMTGEIEQQKQPRSGKSKYVASLKQMKIKFPANDGKSSIQKDSSLKDKEKHSDLHLGSCHVEHMNTTNTLSIDSSSEDEPLSKIAKLNENTLVLKYNKNSYNLKNKVEAISISDDDETPLSVVKKSMVPSKSSASTFQQVTPQKHLTEKPVSRQSPRIVRLEHEKQKRKLHEYKEKKLQEDKKIMDNIKDRELKLEKELQKMKVKYFS